MISKLDHLVLDNQSGGSSSIKRAISSFLSFLGCLQGEAPWDSPSLFVCLLVLSLFRQPYCWDAVGKSSLSSVEDSITVDRLVLSFLQSVSHLSLAVFPGVKESCCRCYQLALQDHLCTVFPSLVVFCCKKFLWWRLRATPICGYKE